MPQRRNFSRRCVRAVIAAIFAGLLVAVGLTARAASAADFGPLDGTWEGNSTFFKAPGDPATATSWVRIIIKDDLAHIFSKKGEILVDKFHVYRHVPSAVIYGIDFSKSGSWVETWTFAVTQKDNSTLIVNAMRVVNNTNVPVTDSNSKVSTFAAGELHRK